MDLLPFKKALLYPVLFGLYWRVPVRRLLASVVGGLAFLGFVLWDWLADRANWWWLDTNGVRGWPGTTYPAMALAFSGIGLIGWRAHRRWGRRGLITFVVLFALITAIGDLHPFAPIEMGALLPGRLLTGFHSKRFGPLFPSLLLDFIAWLSLAASAMAIQIAIAGNASEPEVRERRYEAVYSYGGALLAAGVVITVAIMFLCHAHGMPLDAGSLGVPVAIVIGWLFGLRAGPASAFGGALMGALCLACGVAAARLSGGDPALHAIFSGALGGALAAMVARIMAASFRARA